MDQRTAGWLDNRRLEQVEAYLRAGRPHRDLRLGELRRCWARQFSLWTLDPADLAARRRHEALQSELRLRGEEPPYDRVPEALDRLFAAVGRRIDAMSPDQANGVNAALERGIVEFHDPAAATRH